MTVSRCNSWFPGPALLAVLLLAGIVVSAGCLSNLAFPVPPGSPAARPVEGKLNVYFLDVGQGDAAVILFSNTTILVDAGETDKGGTVTGALRSLGVKKIDLLVATHAHSDHIGGMQKVLDAFPVGRVLDAGVPHTSSLYGKFLETIEEKGIPYTVAEQGAVFNPDPALRMLVLSPPKESSLDGLNENSVVLRVSYGTVDILLMGDAGTGAESALFKTGYPLDAEILKVGHHGSSSSTGPAFLSRVNPSVAIISVGRDNPYGHPHEKTLDALAAAGARVYRTDQSGTIRISSDGASYSVTTTTGTDNPLTLAPSRSPTTVPATSATATASSPGTTAEPLFTIPAIQIGNASYVSIAQTRFNAPGDDRKNLNGEWIVLANSGDEDVLLAGWTLSNRKGVIYTFPPFILETDSAVTIYSGTGNYNDTALFIGRSEPAWGNDGDEAVLRDGSGRVIDRASEG